MSKLSRIAGAGYGVALALLAVGLFPQAFGVVLSDGLWLPLLGTLVLTASGILELASNKMEVSRRDA